MQVVGQPGGNKAAGTGDHRYGGAAGARGAFSFSVVWRERQRAGIARAIVNRPLIVIADEPTGNLEMETSWGIMELLSEINRKGTTVIMATHAQELVRRSHRRVIVLNDGRLSADTMPGAFIA